MAFVNYLRSVTVSLCLILAALGVGQTTFNVTSPTNGDWLNGNKSLTFNGKGASVEVSISATVTSPSGSSTVSTKVNPAVNGDFSGSLNLTFASNAPQGDYTIQVTATEPGKTYTPVNLAVKVDTKLPKLLEYRPAQNSFVKGIVPIRFKLLEDNMKDWRITVGGSDIPNNTGTARDFSVDWNSGTLDNDGAQNIAMTAKDQADNILNFSIPVTLDRRAPVATIQFPNSSTPIRSRADVTVIVDIADQFANAVSVTGIDVIIQRTDGTFVTRVARQSFTDIGNNTWRFTGKLRWRSGFPSTYKVIATGLDKAGNVAVRQEVLVRVNG